ncbi:MAG: pseudouridine synthase [Tenericutes bacterium HGW-Tenericutes-1]|jgi:23S rRNA pseudouridine2605 synthase|nr:MAG: pseudouridine synthase [Tenericutes bacterium HGW-Tenericutes-1]
MERLQKVIAQAGIASRRAAEKMITDGLVSVDGEVVTQLGTLVDDFQSITVNGKLLSREEKVYFLLNKPEGYVSTTEDDKGRKTVLDLVVVPQRIFPIGRLDYDTTGVLLLTNDGDFMNAMIHPKFKVEKEYLVKVEGLLRKETSKQLCRGVNLGDFKSGPAKIFDVKYDDTKTNSFATIIITEGKYHQIKRMFEAVGHPVMKLRRHRFGTVTADGLPLGEYRRLKPHEIKQLWNLSRFGKSEER